MRDTDLQIQSRVTYPKIDLHTCTEIDSVSNLNPSF
jgi:hypothetical protein